MRKGLDLDGFLYFWNLIKNMFVEKVSGMSLIADSEKLRLASLATIKNIGSGLSLSQAGELSCNAVSSPTWNDITGKPSLVNAADKGTPLGVASLDSNGKVPSGQLPSYVDDVVEGYIHEGVFYGTREGSAGEYSYSNTLTGETGKIYVDIASNECYRFGGSVYVVISSGDFTPITNAEILDIIQS